MFRILTNAPTWGGLASVIAEAFDEFVEERLEPGFAGDGGGFVEADPDGGGA